MADESSRRSRSRSPPPRGPKGSKGFRWKDSKPNDRSSDRRDPDRRRDYRDRSPPRNNDQGRFRERDRGGDRGQERHERERDRYQDRNRDHERDHGRDTEKPRRSDAGERSKNDGEKKAKKEKKDKKAAAIAPGQELIVVNINDRLGTKTAVPCLPSDTVGQLKMMIAARIGREAGQIMLRRQGERPFKDVLSLEDYGISNGVQLDLEIDTGD
ncbi:hypothetical protein S7711_04344 [Stachybotrys chartarum IBT 7711]|uniref:Ubiquitin-like modifier HUB1 n=1 Tax=Stachybotrys chartarum (strain CBS 109288 / IBT 7711) TaxID=1280523 RepID=A0A084AY56_STACB|nr:hypothetical protein S7711_04344 [Stachybotrys chartarum IBT 7711]KFA48159.1 hypothetical protein S40293_06913 [Stachybotrys chartarum IBT 40293]